MTGFTFLINANSGKHAGDAVAGAVADRLRDVGHQTRILRTTAAAQVPPLVADAAERGDAVVSVGGDGTLASIAEPVAKAGCALAILPAGRGNDFARTLGLPADAERLAAILARGQTRPIDMLRLDAGAPRLVAGSVYCGVDAAAAELVDHLRWMPGPAQYPCAALRTFASFRPAQFRIDVDGAVRELSAASVVVANSQYYGSGMKIAPSADLSDGLAEVVTIEVRSRRALMTSLPKVYDGRHVELPQVHVTRGRRIAINASARTKMGGDGELLGEVPPLDATAALVEVLPAAVRVIC
ncbi:MAG: YegS/Rv2252/BmrU family lipid kinase [Actinomycetia bacterium]|nr:YegS/Rv2252/BmrU family lipid kinase [Actinomycetes bacterium]